MPDVTINKTVADKLAMFYPVKSGQLDLQVKNVDLTKRTVQFIANTYLYFDSDYDVLVPGASKKSISDRGPSSKAVAKIKHQADHKLNSEHVVGRPTLIEETIIDNKEVLYYESFIPETTKGNDHLINYQEGIYDNHSIGFRYKDIAIAMKESEDEDRRNRWNEWINKIINRNEANKIGYFWLVKEIELFETSVVSFGANSLTGVVGIKSQNKDLQLLQLFNRIDLLGKQLHSGTQSDDMMKTFELETLQLKQLCNDIFKQQPDTKETLIIKPSDLTTEEIKNTIANYKFIK